LLAALLPALFVDSGEPKTFIENKHQIEKRMIRMVFLSMGLLVVLNLNGQNLTKHKWENRVVIIQASSEVNTKYLAQIEAFMNLEEEFRERKLNKSCYDIQSNPSM